MKPGIVIILFILVNFTLTAQINVERFRKSQEALGFGGEAEAQFTIMTGNSDLQVIKGQFRLNYNGGNNYTFGVLGGDFGWQQGKQISNEALLHLRHVNTLSVFLQLEFFAQADYSNPRKLKLRELAGTGVRLRFIKTETAKFNLGIGIMYETEKYNLPPGSEHPVKTNTIRLTNYINTEIDFNKNVKFYSTIYYQPAVTLPVDFRVMGENSFSSSINENLAIVASFNFRLDNRPPDGVKKFDINSGFGFNYSF